MRRELSRIKFEGGGDYDFFEELDTLGIQQIKALSHAIILADAESDRRGPKV